jgi:hypothetical protein
VVTYKFQYPEQLTVSSDCFNNKKTPNEQTLKVWNVMIFIMLYQQWLAPRQEALSQAPFLFLSVVDTLLLLVVSLARLMLVLLLSL